MDAENKKLLKANSQFSAIKDQNDKENDLEEHHTHQLGQVLTDKKIEYEKTLPLDRLIDQREKDLKIDLVALVEYVTWKTNEMTKLRKQAESAEKTIHQMRRSGEGSVESLIDKLMYFRKDQEKLDKQVEELCDKVKTHEALIKMKEDEKADLQSDIENKNQGHNRIMDKYKAELDN